MKYYFLVIVSFLPSISFANGFFIGGAWEVYTNGAGLILADVFEAIVLISNDQSLKAIFGSAMILSIALGAYRFFQDQKIENIISPMVIAPLIVVFFFTNHTKVSVIDFNDVSNNGNTTIA